MAARAMWRGEIELGSITVPVKLYAAARERAVHFRLLHERDGVPVAQRMVHPDTGEVVPAAETRRGYEVERGLFVTLDAEDLAELEPAPSRTIRVLRFVDPDRVDPAWYARPYYLGPDGSEGRAAPTSRWRRRSRTPAARASCAGSCARRTTSARSKRKAQ